MGRVVRGPQHVRRVALRPVRPDGWWLDAAMEAGFVIVTAALALGPIRALDLAIRDLADAHRPPIADTATQWLNRFGSGSLLAVLTLLVALVLASRGRSAWPLAPVGAALLLTGLVIQPLKLVFHRAAPHSPLPDDVEVRLFSQPEGLSYPSGHAVNSVVWYGVVCLLLAAWLRPAARRWLRFAPPVVVGFTSTYLGYHWFTDLLAGICLGIVIDRLIARVPWPALPPAYPGD